MPRPTEKNPTTHTITTTDGYKITVFTWKRSGKWAFQVGGAGTLSEGKGGPIGMFVTEKNALGVARKFLELWPRGRRPFKGAKKNPGRGTRVKNPAERDLDAERDLELYIVNTAELYPQFQSIQKNLATKKAKGAYDAALAIKLFMYLVESGAKQYVKEMGITLPWHKVFPVPSRREISKSLRDSFQQSYKAGEYDHMLPKKYQKKTNPKASKKNPRGSSRAPFALKDATFADLDAKVIEVEAGDKLHKWRPGPPMLWSPEAQALVMMEGVKLGRSTRNPDARSEDARGRFSGRESDKVRSGRIPDLEWQKLGPVRALTYRFNGNKTAWEHPFSRPPTLHRGDGPGGVRMWVVRGGGLRLTRRGIMG